MFSIVLHECKASFEAVYVSCDGIAAIREVERLYSEAIKKISTDSLCSNSHWLGYAEIETTSGYERWIAAPFHGTKENLKTFVNQLKGRL